MKLITKLLTLFYIFTLVGCVFTDHDIPNRYRIIKRESVGYATSTYTHSGANRLAKETFVPVIAVEPYYIDFTSFDPSNRLLEAIQHFAIPSRDLAHEVLRDSDGRITRIRKYCVGGPTCTSGIWYFTYPAANTVDVKFWDNGSLFRSTDSFTFNSAGQVTQVKHYNSVDELLTTTTNITFDDKRDIFSYYPEGFLTVPVGNNNVLTFQILTHATSTVTNGTYAYEYNRDGWVTKRTRTGARDEILEYEAY